MPPMRNREQIYGQEAAGLLRNITVYHCIRHDHGIFRPHRPCENARKYRLCHTVVMCAVFDTAKTL